VLAILYFVVIQYVWVPKDAAGNRTANVYASLLVAVVGFIAYTCIAYLVDRFTYNRRLRKLKGSGK
jgi:Flp pilus assembly protein TadB